MKSRDGLECNNDTLLVCMSESMGGKHVPGFKGNMTLQPEGEMFTQDIVGEEVWPWLSDPFLYTLLAVLCVTKFIIFLQFINRSIVILL